MLNYTIGELLGGARKPVQATSEDPNTYREMCECGKGFVVEMGLCKECAEEAYRQDALILKQDLEYSRGA